MLPAVLLGFAAALAAPLLLRIGREGAGWLIAVVPLTLLVYFIRFAEGIASGEVFLVSYPWVPALGIDLSFRLDGLSLLFVLLITGIGVLIFIYTGAYLSGHPQLGRLYGYLLTFMASMLGLALADNVIVLFVFWELTSISSYLLIGFNHERESSRASALQALLITGAGGLALLAGLMLMGQAGGSLEISTLLGRGEAVRSHPLYLPILFLVLAGAFTKSAQFPFHFWLPNAMEAPTPVSAYLHSATMVKAGVYLLARFSPVLGGTFAWNHTLIPIGAATMLIGATLALVHTDLKRILAYSTVSALGMLFLTLGIGTAEAFQALTVFLLAHALYKGSLFLAVGIIDHETGTRDAKRLGGLFRVMPLTATAAGLAALSNAGIPPLFGFIGKELTYKAAFGEPIADVLITVVLLANISFVAVAALVGIRPFWGRRGDTPKRAHRPSPSLWLGPLLLAGVSLGIGLAPDLIARVIISPSVAAIERQTVEVELALWHGFHPALILSVIGFVIGVGVFWKWDRIRGWVGWLNVLSRWGPEQSYRWALHGLNIFARGQTRLLQNGRLPIYLLVVILTFVAFTGVPLLVNETTFGMSRWTDAPLYELLLALVILSAAVLLVGTRSRLTAVAALGVVGYGVALLFLIFSAPDLAMTQFAIETLSIILLVLVLLRLPASKSASKPPERLRDLITALLGGAVMTALVLAATATPRDSRLAPYFVEHSVPVAKGRNLVNVILVDFRGLDTLGEIVVLSVAALGVHSLLKLRVRAKDQKEP